MNLNQVAIVILNWNGKFFLETFLPIVIKYSAGVQIIVADNNSDDDSVAFLKTYFPTVSVILNSSNDGFAKGYNTALKQVNAKYYVLLNSDVEVAENWIEPIITLMNADKKIAACQPKILDYNNKQFFEYAGACGGFIDKYGYPFCRGRIFNVLEKDIGQYNNSMEIFWATGACMFIRAEAFWSVGGFDDDYFAHMEEIDICWRMKNNGYTIYVQPTSFVYHVGGGTLNKLSARKTFLNFRNNLITFTKNAASPYLVFIVLWRMMLDGVAAFKFLLEGNGSHFFAVIYAHIAYYRQLPATLKKRKQLRSHMSYKAATTGIYKKSSVFSHFIKQKNYYTQL